MILLDTQFEIVPSEEAAARHFDNLRRRKLCMGSRDLKIAATAMVNHALLLSANRADFETVSGVRVENWQNRWDAVREMRGKMENRSGRWDVAWACRPTVREWQGNRDVD